MENCIFTIIIVNWNTKELTTKCIQSIYEKKLMVPFEIILVDNASSDGTAQYVCNEFPDICIIENDENVGFARANNQGIRQAKGKYILLLNSDTALKSEKPLIRMSEYFENNLNTGIVGGTLVLPNGKIQSQGRQFLSLKILVKQQILFSSAQLFKRFIRQNEQQDYKADYVDGAFLCIRKSVIEQIGLLNENYFIYGEDMEWCYRAKQAGWKVSVLPDIVVLHEHAASSRQNFRRVLLNNALNNSRFICLAHGKTRAKIAFNIYLLGMLLRIPLSIMRKNGLGKDYMHGFIDCLKQLGCLEDILESGHTS
jgi:GT2 family glycosyltransferase